MFKVLIYSIYTLLSVFGLYYIKISNFGFNGNFILGVILYGSGFAIWLVILKTNSLSVAFPIASSALLIGTQIVGFYFLNEVLNTSKIIGIFFVIIGIILIY